MSTQTGSLVAQLEAFARENRALLENGKRILPLLGDEQARNHVDKPLLLKLVLEKYLELIEEKLLPSLPKGEAHETAPQTTASTATASTQANSATHESTDPSYHVARTRIVEDFRNTDPRYRPIQRVAQPAPRPVQVNSPSAYDQVHSANRVTPGESRPPMAPTQQHASSAHPHVAPVQQHSGPVHHPPVALPDAPKANANWSHVTHDARLENPDGSRRTIPRYSCRVPLAYAIKGQDKTQQKAYTKDVGAMGLFILANRPEKTGNTVEIEVVMPGDKTAVLQGVVRWTKWVPQNLRSVDTPGFGVRITSAPETWYNFFMNLPKKETATAAPA